MRSRLWLCCIVLMGLLITAYTSYNAYQTETKLAESRYHGVIEAFSSYVLREMQRTGTILFVLKGFIDSQQKLQYDSLLPVVSEVMNNFDRLQGVLWVPKVPAENRQVFEAENSRGGYYSIFEVVNGVPSPAAQRPYYFPVQFQLAEDGPIIPPGFDLAATAMAQFLPQLAHAGDRIFLLPMFNPAEPGVMSAGVGENGLMVLTPTYEDPEKPKDLENLRGFLITIIRAEPLSADAGWELEDNIQISVLDVSDPNNPQDVVPKQEFKPEELVHSMKYQRRLPMVGGLQWDMQAVPSKKFIDSRRTTHPLVIGLGGVFATLLAAGYFGFLRNQNVRINAEVENRTKELNEANHQLEILSATDGLTGLANRRHFDQYLEQEWQRAYRSQKALTLVLVDIDEFKNYNDRYGHIAGDNCLQKVAGVLHANFSRPADLVARYGGEEFAIVVPDMDAANADLGERCRQSVTELRIPHAASRVAGYITLSIGVCTILPSHGMEPADLIRFADEAMYEAKNGGRNRVVFRDKRANDKARNTAS